MKIALKFPKKSPVKEMLNKKRRFLHDILKLDALRTEADIARDKRGQPTPWKK